MGELVRPHTRTTSTGTTVTVRLLAGDWLVTFDNPNAPGHMRDLEVGRVVDGGFQPHPFAAFAITPETLRAIAELVEEVGEVVVDA